MKAFFIFMKKETEKESLFMNYSWHERNNVPVNAGQYGFVYGGFYNQEDTDMEILDSVYSLFNMNKPADYNRRSVSVSDVIAIAGKDGVHAYFVDSFGFTEVPGFLSGWREELAVRIENRYISIVDCEDGYDYNLYDHKFRLLDGGIDEDFNASTFTVLYELLRSEFFEASFNERTCVIRGNVDWSSSIRRIDYELFKNNVDETPVNMQELYMEQKLENFRKQRAEVFKFVDGMDAEMLEEHALALAEELLDDVEVKVTGILLVGSRARGEEKPDSDIDFLLEYEGDMKEYTVFNILAGESLLVGGVPIDFNPIRSEESGTIVSYVTENF